MNRYFYFFIFFSESVELVFSRNTQLLGFPDGFYNVISKSGLQDNCRASFRLFVLFLAQQADIRVWTQYFSIILELIERQGLFKLTAILS